MKYIKGINNFENALLLGAQQVERIKKSIARAYDQEWHKDGTNIDQINALVAPDLRTPEEAAKATVPKDCPYLFDELIIGNFKAGAQYEHPIAYEAGYNECKKLVEKGYDSGYKLGNSQGFNQAIEDVLRMFEPLFVIEPSAKNIVQIATKVKSIYDEIQKLSH